MHSSWNSSVQTELQVSSAPSLAEPRAFQLQGARLGDRVSEDLIPHFCWLKWRAN